MNENTKKRATELLEEFNTRITGSENLGRDRKTIHPRFIHNYEITLEMIKWICEKLAEIESNTTKPQG